MRSTAASIAFLAILVALLVAEPSARPAAAEFEPDSAGMSDVPLTVEQERAIADTLVRHLTTAWNQADVDAWFAQYWPDAESITLRGELLTDRKEIRERHAALWSGIFKGSRIKMTIRRVRSLGTAALLVETDCELTGYASLPAGVRARPDGALATRQSLVLLNRFGRWRIISTQSTAVRAQAER